MWLIGSLVVVRLIKLVFPELLAGKTLRLGKDKDK
jgi:hypothetical protein